MGFVSWVIFAPLLAAVIWFVWYIWNSSATLDARIAAGDDSLLYSNSFNISEVIRAPFGSKIDLVKTVIPQNQIAMMPIQLADGRVMMVPVKVVSSHASMQGIQPLPVHRKE
jgi:hypothetical protein